MDKYVVGEDGVADDVAADEEKINGSVTDGIGDRVDKRTEEEMVRDVGIVDDIEGNIC